MNTSYKNYFYLAVWIISLISIGSIIGYLTKPESNFWYESLKLSKLTPPNYIFPIAWTILYGILGFCGWKIWINNSLKLKNIKLLFSIQMILNWSWTPLFFYYHLVGISLLVLCIMDILVGIIIIKLCKKIRLVAILMIPYFIWIIFATYLSLYIYLYN